MNVNINTYGSIVDDRQNVIYAEKSIKNHKELVQKIAKKLPIEYYDLIKDQIKVHDDDKLTSNTTKSAFVFIASVFDRKECFGNLLMDSNVESILKGAIIHHITNNKHHPEYWVKNFSIQDYLNYKTMKVGKMDEAAIIEMVCDWASVSYSIYGHFNELFTWLNSINDKYLFEDDDKDMIIELIYLISEIEEV